MRHDPVQSISTFSNAEFAFNIVPITDILVLLLLCLLRDFPIFGRSAERWSCDLDTTFLAPGNCFTIPVDLVDQHSLGITSVALFVSLDCLEEITDFIECFKGNSFHSCVSVHHADMNLRSEFGSGMCFSSDDGSYPMLANTDDFVRDAVRSVLIHEQLLFIERCQDV